MTRSGARRTRPAAAGGGLRLTTTWRSTMFRGGTRMFARAGPPRRLARSGAICGAPALD
jgi:hypothetical protein